MPKLKVNGASLNYEIAGPKDSALVVLSNSLSTDLRMWAPQAASLAQRHRVLRYDTRGHGQSKATPAPYHIDTLADDLAGLLDALADRPAHIVGLSLGGMTAQVLAIRRPELVASLCLVATTCRPPFGTRAAWAARAEEVRAAGGHDAMLNPMLDRWLTRRFRRARPDAVAAITDMILSTPLEGYVGCCHAIGSLDACGRLADFPRPICVIAGEEDPGTTVEDAEMIGAGLAHAELHVVPHARHLLNWDGEPAFTAMLTQWLAKVAALNLGSPVMRDIGTVG